MDKSFFTAAVGAGAQQAKLDVIGHNIANTNTTAYKTKQAVFSDLLYSNMRAREDENTRLVAGSGIRMEKDDTLFTEGAMMPTHRDLDFFIVGSGFFALEDPTTGEITYTRNGNFELSLHDDDRFYLVSSTGKYVLDTQNEPISVEHVRSTNYNAEEQLATEAVVQIMIGATTQEEIFGVDEDEMPLDTANIRMVAIYDFPNKNGMLNLGNNEYSPVAKNGEPVMILPDGSKVRKGLLEGSNVSEAKEFTNLIETQRAYQLALRMIQTADEIENVYNNLRS